MLRKLAILRRSVRVLWRFPLRSGLAILSAAIGVSGALTSVNYALGGRLKVTNQLASLGTNILSVTPRQSRNTGVRARTGAPVTTLKLADRDAVRREVPLFAESAAFLNQNYLVRAGDLSKKGCLVSGVEPGYFAIKNWPLREGVAFETADLRRTARLVVLGATVAKDLFGDASPVHERVLINRVPFEVTGALTERGQSLDAANEDDQVYVPLTTAMHRLANVDYLSGILFAVGSWEEMDEAARATAGVLSQRHATIAKLGPDFQLQNQKQLLDTQIAASEQLLFFVRWIGASALCVSGLGILAISWIGIRERTREIGTRRALGATRSDIFFQVVSEAFVLSCAGCFLGVFLAAEAADLLAKWAGQPRVFDLSSACLAVAAAGSLNLAFAALPAKGAAWLDPIEALRFE
jgi:putative ABC transport system permease protein